MKTLLISILLLTMVSCNTLGTLAEAPLMSGGQLWQLPADIILDSVDILSGEYNEFMPNFDECMTDACIAERTGDIDPVDPYEGIPVTEDEREMENADPSLFTEDEDEFVYKEDDIND